MKKVKAFYWILLSVFLGICFHANAQDDEINGYFKSYSAYSDANKYDSAIVYSQKAAAYYDRAQDTVNFLYCYYILKTNIYILKGDYLKALQIMEEYNKVIDAFKQGNNQYVLYWYYNTYGFLYSSQDNHKDALKYYLYAKEYCANAYGKDSGTMAWLALALSDTYRMSGEYQEALKQIEFAEKIYLGQKDNLSYASCLITRGNVYSLTGDYQAAIDHTLRCKEIVEAEASREASDRFLSTVYNNVGVAYLYWDKHQEAIRYFKLAKEQGLKTAANDITIGRIWFNMGYSYEKLDSLTLALESEYKAQDLLLKLPLTNDMLLAWSYNICTKVLIKQKEYTRALEYVQYALYQNAMLDGRMVDKKYVPYYGVKEVLRNPQEQNCFDHSRLLESVILKIEVLQKLNGKGEYSYLIRKCINDADTIATHSRNFYTTDKDKVEMMKQSFALSDQAITFYHHENLRKEGRENIVSAFNFSEKTKASVLLEVLRGAEAKSFAGVPDKVIGYADSLQSVIARKKELAISKADAERDKILLEMQGTQVYFKKYQDFIQQKYPDYYDLKYADNIVELTQLQQHLKPQTAILSYFLGDSTLSVFMITQQELKLYRNPLNPQLLRMCKGLKSSIIHKNDDLYKRLAYELYNTLFFFPLPADVRDLVIVPHDFLSNVPFEALLAEPARDKAFTELNYLVKKYNVSYAYSVSLFDRMLKKKHVVAKQQFLGVAPVFKSKNKISGELKRSLTAMVDDADDSDGYQEKELTRTISNDEITPIPGTEIEVSTIKKLFDKNKLSAFMFLNESATEQSIKQHPLGNYKFIHIATHGFVDNNQPENSGIILHHMANNKEDNVLYAKEIYNLRLNADLVTLSACETGLGQIKKGEGLIGLTRPLLFAGAKNIMVSLWKVSDASTTELMIDFYKKAIVQTAFNRSLSDAKRQLISNPEFAQPYYWAAFVLIGE